MRKPFKILALLLLGIFCFVYLNFFSSFVFPWQEKNAIETTLNWGGLAELPKMKKDLNVEKVGNAFTRTFIIEFNASQNEIENWIKNSKRLRENKPKRNGPLKAYKIYPGENESFGGTVNIVNEKVTIRMSWS